MFRPNEIRREYTAQIIEALTNGKLARTPARTALTASEADFGGCGLWSVLARTTLSANRGMISARFNASNHRALSASVGFPSRFDRVA